MGTGHRFDQARAQAFQNRGVPQPLPHHRRLATQDLVEQELLGSRRSAGDSCQQSILLLAAADGTGRQTHRYRPALRHSVKALGVRFVQGLAQGLGDEVNRIRLVELEIGHPDLGHQVTRPVAGQRQQWIPPAEQYEMNVAGRLADHEVQQVVDRDAGALMVVVESQYEAVPDLVEIVGQPRRDHGRRGQLDGPEHGSDLRAGTGVEAAHRGDQVLEKDPRLIVAFIQ